MLRNSLICIFSLCLLQLMHAIPVDRSSSEEMEPRQELQTMVVVELTRLAKESIDEGRVVITDAIRELNALPWQSEGLQTNITRLSDFLRETKDLNLKADEQNLKKIFGSMSKLAKLMRDYEEMPENDRLTETLRTALEKSGWIKFESEFKKRTADFIEHFERTLNLYLTRISERERDPKLISWFDKFKAETEDDRRLESFGELFTILNQANL